MTLNEQNIRKTLDYVFFLINSQDIQSATAALRALPSTKFKNTLLNYDLLKASIILNQVEIIEKSISNLLRVKEVDTKAFSNLIIWLISNKQHQYALNLLEQHKRKIINNDNGLKFYSFYYGLCLKELGKINEAKSIYETNYQILIDIPEFHYNFANCLFQCGEPKAAIVEYERSIEKLGRLDSILHNLAEAYSLTGNLEASKKIFHELISRNPNNEHARLSLALVELKVKEFKTGWHNYESRWRVDYFVEKEFKSYRDLAKKIHQLTSIGDLKNKSIAIFDEQGIGDTIMFLSFIPDLIEYGLDFEIFVDVRLIKIVKSSFPEIVVHDRAEFFEKNDNYDLIIPIGNLAKILRQSPSDFNGASYLKPSDDSVAEMSSFIISSTTNRKKVGISWRGGMANTAQGLRSINPNIFEHFFNQIDADFYCLQHRASESEINNFSAPFRENLFVFYDNELNDIDSLAALISKMDLIVSVQNTNIHIAGSIGAPTLALIPTSPEWRYGLDGDQMLWYSSVKLFRQGIDTSWNECKPEIHRLINTYLF